MTLDFWIRETASRTALRKTPGPFWPTPPRRSCILDGDASRIRQFILWITLVSFAVEILLAEAWLRLVRNSSVSDLLLDRPAHLEAIAAGAALAVAVALASRVFFSTFARRLAEELFVPLFARVRYPDILALSLLPGLGEEILFRGVLQPEVGLLPASLIFGLLHSGLSRRLLPYGLWAAIVGALLGLLFLWTGNLWGSIVAHSLVNAAGVLWIKSISKRGASSE